MAAERSEKERTPGRSGPLIFLVVAGVMLLSALYVLSVGPVVWLVERNYLDGNSPLIKVLYIPLGLVVSYCPPLERALDGYMELFR